MVQASGLEDHWSVREEAARLAALVCAKYGQPYYQIQPRITQALNTAFQQTNNPLTTHYGMAFSSSQTPSQPTYYAFQQTDNPLATQYGMPPSNLHNHPLCYAFHQTGNSPATQYGMPFSSPKPQPLPPPSPHHHPLQRTQGHLLQHCRGYCGLDSSGPPGSAQCPVPQPASLLGPPARPDAAVWQ